MQGEPIEVTLDMRDVAPSPYDCYPCKGCDDCLDSSELYYTEVKEGMEGYSRGYFCENCLWHMKVGCGLTLLDVFQHYSEKGEPIRHDRSN